MNKKLITIISTLIIAIISMFYYTNSNNFFIKINNNNISLDEFKVYLSEQISLFELIGGDDIWDTNFDGVNAEEVAKENALKSIITVKTTNNQAKKFNIYLTDSEKSLAKKDGEYFYENIPDNINLSKEKCISIVKELEIEQKVYEFITNNFVISEPDFEAYFDNYLEDNKSFLNDVYVKYILLDKDSEDLIDKVYEELMKTNDFDKIQKKYSQSKIFDEILVSEKNFDENIENEIYSLKENEISNVLEGSDGFYIIKTTKIKELDMNELKKIHKQQYTEDKKQEIYKEQIDTWNKSTKITKNLKAWNSLNVK